MLFRRFQPFSIRTWRREIAVVAALFLVALLLRLFQIDAAPPGLNGDEVYNIIDALSIRQGNLPIFFPGNQGREALYFYLLATSLRLFGVTVWSLRLPSVLLGSAVVLLAYVAGREMFHRRVGIVAAALVAVSFWPVMLSRMGLRAISLTFFTTLTIVLLYRALQSGSRRFWLLGGMSLGLTLYTYIPARIFPIVIAGWLGWVWWRRRKQLARNGRHLISSILLAVLISTPFVVYMVRYPERVNQRITSMTNAWDQARGGEPEALLASVGGVLKMFSVEGDEEWRYHLAHQPIFDPITSLFFYLGLGLTLIRAFRSAGEREGDERRRQPEYALLLLWLGAMLAPNAVLNENPSFIRAAGAIVPVYLIAGVGVHTAFRILQQRAKVPFWFAPLLIGAGLLAMLARTTHDYFGVWVNHPQVRTVYHAQQALMGRYLESHAIGPETRIFIAYDYVYDRPTALSFSLFTKQDVAWFSRENTFPWPGDGESRGDVWYLIPAEHALPADMLTSLQQDAELEPVYFADGALAFTVYRMRPREVMFAPEYDLDLSFEAGPHLAGYDIPESIFSGEPLNIRLYWQVPGSAAQHVNRLTYVQVHLADVTGAVRARADTLLGYPQAGWVAGDQFVQDVRVETPAGMLPGPASLAIGLRDGEGNPLGPLQEDSGRSPLLIRNRPLTEFSLLPEMRLFDDSVVLTSANFSPLLTPGSVLNIELRWVPLEIPAQDYRLRLSLHEAGDGGEQLSEVFALLPDVYPPSRWRPLEPVTSLHGLRVPVDFEADGPLTLQVELLPAIQSEDQPLPASGGSNVLGEVNVDARARLFDRPELENEVNVQFGEAFRLIGYELDTSNAHVGGSVNLTLAWQALETPDDNYTVFNHLVGEDGQIRGQFDSPPVGDAWLTETWLPGEIVVEERRIEIFPDAQPGMVNLLVGLYNADNLQRLPVRQDQGESGDQFLVAQFHIAGSPSGNQ